MDIVVLFFTLSNCQQAVLVQECFYGILQDYTNIRDSLGPLYQDCGAVLLSVMNSGGHELSNYKLPLEFLIQPPKTEVVEGCLGT